MKKQADAKQKVGDWFALSDTAERTERRWTTQQPCSLANLIRHFTWSALRHQSQSEMAKWRDVIARQCPHALICHPLIQHHCATLTLARTSVSAVPNVDLFGKQQWKDVRQCHCWDKRVIFSQDPCASPRRFIVGYSKRGHGVWRSYMWGLGR